MDDEDAPAGSPRWMATFADLMSLLMCFFVLLLSFSELDAQKYKLIAGSLKNAFGVQKEVIAHERVSGARDAEIVTPNPEADPDTKTEREMMEEVERLVEDTRRDLRRIEENLEIEIDGGLLDVESGFRTITIRIKEKGSFPSGSADLQASFVDVMEKLRDVIAGIEGRISVEGHTDDIDIRTERFPSNWALSTARALSVARELMKDDVIPQSRFVVLGYADTKAYMDNGTPEGRAGNRRVELVIRQPIGDGARTSLEALGESNPDFLEALEAEGIESFEG